MAGASLLRFDGRRAASKTSDRIQFAADIAPAKRRGSWSDDESEEAVTPVRQDAAERGDRNGRKHAVEKSKVERAGADPQDAPMGASRVPAAPLHQIHYALFFEECAGFDITPVQYGLLTTCRSIRTSTRTRSAASSGSTAPTSPTCSTASPGAVCWNAAAARTTAHGAGAAHPGRPERRPTRCTRRCSARRIGCSSRCPAPASGLHHHADPLDRRQQPPRPHDLRAELRRFTLADPCSLSPWERGGVRG